MQYFSLGILILVLAISLFARRLFHNHPSLATGNGGKIYKIAFISAIILIFMVLLFLTWRQYNLWLEHDVSKNLLPPYTGINYFIFYAFTRFFAPYLVSLAVAVLFLFSAKSANKKYGERFFYPEENYFGALAIFATGHPGWLFYAVFLIVIYLLIHLYSLFIINKPERLSLYYLWLPAAIFVIIIQNWLVKLPLWSLLKL